MKTQTKVLNTVAFELGKNGYTNGIKMAAHCKGCMSLIAQGNDTINTLDSWNAGFWFAYREETKNITMQF